MNSKQNVLAVTTQLHNRLSTIQAQQNQLELLINSSPMIKTLPERRLQGRPIRAIIIVDLSFLLLNLAFLENLLDCLPHDFCVIMPWISVLELDQVGIVGGGEMSGLQEQARLLIQKNVGRNTFICRQSWDECLLTDSVGQLAIPQLQKSPVELVVDCCLFYHKNVSQALVLLSCDEQVSQLASNVHQIPVISTWDSGSGLDFVNVLQSKLGGFKSMQHLILHVTINCLNLLLTQLPKTLFHYFNLAYGMDYVEIIARPPPWSLHDMLFMIRKHWIAVFSEHYKPSNNNPTTNSPGQKRNSSKSIEEACRRMEAFVQRWCDKGVIWDNTPVTVAIQQNVGGGIQANYALTKSSQLRSKWTPEQSGYMTITAGELNSIMLDTLELLQLLVMQEQEKNQIRQQIMEWTRMAREWIQS